MRKPEDKNNNINQKSYALRSYYETVRLIIGKSNVAVGLITGTFISGVFNPWDRALYLSVKYSRPFLSSANFTSPYQGYAQAMVQRSVFGGLYYVLQSQMKTTIYPHLCGMGVNESGAQFIIGLGAGTLNGIMVNPMSAIKYHTWGRDDRSFSKSFIEMMKEGGIKPFLRGTKATVYREVAFACPYEVIRTWLRQYLFTRYNPEHSKAINLGSNIAAAGISTVVSSPFNYVRNMHYAMPPAQKAPSTKEVLTQLHEEGKKISNPYARARFFQNQLRLGWGTARVAVGMAAGQVMFDYLKTPSPT